jgi:hypothetical protein
LTSATTAGVRAGGSPFWTIEPEWHGEIAFVIAGGPSVLSQNVDRLGGRKVIVINSSCYCAPWAEFLFFGDARWWRENRAGCDAFQGRILTTAATHDPRALRLKKRLPEHGFATAPDELTWRRTSLAATLNVIGHLRPDRVVLLGADGRFSKDGRRNHHAPHKWAHRNGTWEDQRAELALTVKPLRALGIDVLNASPGSALPFWPIVTLEDML